MKSGTVKDALEIVGIFALVASLVFVGLQMRQAQKIAIAETQLGLMEGWLQVNQAINDNAPVWVRGGAGDSLGAADSVVFANLVLMVNEVAVANLLRAILLGEDDVAASSITDFATFLHRHPGAQRVWLDREDDLVRGRTIVSPERETYDFWRDGVRADLQKLEGADP